MLRCMRTTRASSALALLPLLAACAADAPPPAAPPPPLPPATVATADTPAPSPAPTPGTPRQLADDTTITTASGATFTASKGWWVTQSPDVIVLEDPDRAFKVTFLETPEPDALKAIDGSWQKIEPGFALKRLHDPATPPPVRGWEAVTDTDYDTKTAEHRAVLATARRYNGTTYVTLTDGDAGALSKRGAQHNTAVWTFKPTGMHEESFAGKTPRPIDDARAKDLDAFIEQVRARFGVPGIAVAVVEGGKVAYEKGFGVRELGKKEPVTPSTLFMMGSISKSMTTWMEATLVDAGKLRWDEPVTEALPTFALGDADTTSKLQMWHMSCACTGMPRRDMELAFNFANVTPEQSVMTLKTMKPTTGLGETFQYSNLMVAAGGFAAAHAYDAKRSLGDAYDDAMAKNVFAAVGMKSTTLDFKVAQRGEHAMPSSETIDGTPRAIPLAYEHFVTPLRPAGGVWSNLHDMERYVMTEMAKGVTPEGKRVVSEANLLERRKQRVRSGELNGYGLGLSVGTFRDLPEIDHNGGTFGFSTLMFMLPEQNTAILAFTNSTIGGWILGLVHRKIVEELFEGARDLAAARVEFSVKQRRDGIAKELEKLNRSPDPAWVKGLAGTYTNDSLGRVVLAAGAKSGGGTFDAGEWKSAFVQKKEDDGTIKVALVDPPSAGLELVVGGDVASPTLTLIDDQVKYVFTRSK
jgi:CubicO group peptidase (beta-lactamase class C family)